MKDVYVRLGVGTAGKSDIPSLYLSTTPMIASSSLTQKKTITLQQKNLGKNINPTPQRAALLYKVVQAARSARTPQGRHPSARIRSSRARTPKANANKHSYATPQPPPSRAPPPPSLSPSRTTTRRRRSTAPLRHRWCWRSGSMLQQQRRRRHGRYWRRRRS